MKRSAGKPSSPVKVKTPKRSGPRGRRRGKLTLEDSLRAVLIAAICICTAAAVFITLIVIRSSLPVKRDAPLVHPPAAEDVSGETDSPPPADAPARVREAPPAETHVPSPLPGDAPSAGGAAKVSRNGEPAPQAPPASQAPPEAVSRKPAPQTPPASQAPAARPELPEPRRRGVLAFMIDDAGNNLRELEPFLRFPGPLTIAVLPGLPHSAEAARRIRAAGKEVFLHQPMEALGGQDPGPGAVYSAMGDAEVRTIVERNLAEIGPVAGMNNHQGSRITMDERIMEIILTLCREQGIYFLDSRTTAATVAPAVAERMEIRIGERDVFLDNLPEKAAMVRAVEEGLARASRKGSAVMIGHTWSPELAAAMEELYPDLIRQGYSLSTVSKLIQEGR